MSPEEYVQLALRTEAPSAIARNMIEAEPWGESLSLRVVHAALGLQDEVGEIAKATKSHLFYGAPLDTVNLVEEVGDALWYLALLCDALKVPMSFVMDRNIRKLRKRFPERFTSEAAAEENRDRQAEREVFTEDKR